MGLGPAVLVPDVEIETDARAVAAGGESRRTTGGDRAAALSRIATARTESRIPGLVDLLTAAGVAVVVLKGPATRQRLYALDEERPVADIDLLVAPSSFRTASRLLASAGFDRAVGSGHSDTFCGLGVALDLHLALPYATAPPARAFRYLLAHADSMEVAGHPVPVLDAPTHVVHLALHAAQNGFDSAHRSLDEWRRGWASLTLRERAIAELAVDELGVAPTWVLARLALERPDDRARLAEALPVRRLVPTGGGVWAFATSPIPARVQGRALQAYLRHQWSDDVLDAWRVRRRLDPVAHHTMAARRAKVQRLAHVTGSALRGWWR